MTSTRLWLCAAAAHSPEYRHGPASMNPSCLHALAVSYLTPRALARATAAAGSEVVQRWSTTVPPAVNPWSTTGTGTGTDSGRQRTRRGKKQTTNKRTGGVYKLWHVNVGTSPHSGNGGAGAATSSS